ncbi:MAG: hypothetical protein ACO3TI_07500, partial [Aquiluna sp.]
ILPPPQEPQPLSPLEDLMVLSQGKPIRAFPGQDHQAHISAKMAILQDPQVGQNPVFGPMLPAIQANVREHTLLQFAEFAQASGASGDQAQALAITQVVQQHVAQAQMQLQQMQQMQQDPTVQLGMAELQLRAKEHEDKMLNNAAQLAVRNRELDLRQQSQDQKGYIEGLKIKQKDADSTRNAALQSVQALRRQTGAQ